MEVTTNGLIETTIGELMEATTLTGLLIAYINSIVLTGTRGKRRNFVKICL